jgi:hypothetical protein
MEDQITQHETDQSPGGRNDRRQGEVFPRPFQEWGVALVLGAQDPAAPCGERLARSQAEKAIIAQGADWLSIQPGAHGLSCILNDHRAGLVGQGPDMLNGLWNPERVDTDHAQGLPADACLQVILPESHGVRGDVNKAWS